MKFFFNMLVLNIESGPNERYTHDLSKFLENRFKGWNRNPRFEILHARVSPLTLFVQTQRNVCIVAFRPIYYAVVLSNRDGNAAALLDIYTRNA